jgi:predicted SprT family Zn-dependent metalloprotease
MPPTEEKQYKYVCECGEEYLSDIGFQQVYCIQCGKTITRMESD